MRKGEEAGMDRHLTVIGTGVMGRGIAYSAALGGFEVRIWDADAEALKRAAADISLLFEKAVERGRLEADQAMERKHAIRYCGSLEEAAAGASCVIEAVPEKMEIKKKVFEDLDILVPHDCILATNTSTMSPTEIGSYTRRPDRVIAMHFFNPVHRMPLVEIVRGLETADFAVRTAEIIARKMGKETVIIREFPGFVTSRISALVGNEAFHMLQEGLGSPEDIDKAIKLGLNYPMGPFELGDLVGLDTRLSNLEYLHRTLGEKYRPAPLLIQYVKAGRLGRKTGRGVYNYSGGTAGQEE